MARKTGNGTHKRIKKEKSKKETGLFERKSEKSANVIRLTVRNSLGRLEKALEY